MRISPKLLATLSLITGLVIVAVPVRARADGIPIAGNVFEGSTLTVNGFLITNPNALTAATLTGLLISVTTQNVEGDPTDYVATANTAGGTCLTFPTLAGGAACTVNLKFTTSVAPVPDLPVDFGVSQITMSYTFDNNGVILKQPINIQVNDVPPVPESGSAVLVGSGIGALLGGVGLAKRRNAQSVPPLHN